MLPWAVTEIDRVPPGLVSLVNPWSLPIRRDQHALQVEFDGHVYVAVVQSEALQGAQAEVLQLRRAV